MKKTIIWGVSLVALSLTGCATDSQNQYNASEVGKQVDVDFGTVVAERQVKVQDQNTGVGALGGAAAGGLAGHAFGQGGGNAAATIGGLVIGAIAGAVVEHELQNRTGIEYTITKTDGHTIIIVQNIASDDKPIPVGHRVMIQTSGGYKIKSGDKTTYQASSQYVRVLPADDLPTEISKPKAISFKK